MLVEQVYKAKVQQLLHTPEKGFISVKKQDDIDTPAADSICLKNVNNHTLMSSHYANGLARKVIATGSKFKNIHTL